MLLLNISYEELIVTHIISDNSIHVYFIWLYIHEFILCYTYNRYWSVELERKKKGHVPRLWLTWFKCFWMRIIFQGFVLLSVVSIVHNLFLFHVIVYRYPV